MCGARTQRRNLWAARSVGIIDRELAVRKTAIRLGQRGGSRLFFRQPAFAQALENGLKLGQKRQVVAHRRPRRAASRRIDPLTEEAPCDGSCRTTLGQRLAERLGPHPPGSTPGGPAALSLPLPPVTPAQTTTRP